MNKFRDWIIVVVVVMAGGAFTANQLGFVGGHSDGTTTITGKQAGVAYRVALVKTHAKALREAAVEVEKPDGDIGKAMTTMQAAWQAARTEAFDKLVKPGMEEVVPEGTAKLTPSQRTRYSAFLRDMAAAEEEVR